MNNTYIIYSNCGRKLLKEIKINNKKSFAENLFCDGILYREMAYLKDKSYTFKSKPVLIGKIQLTCWSFIYNNFKEKLSRNLTLKFIKVKDVK